MQRKLIVEFRVFRLVRALQKAYLEGIIWIDRYLGFHWTNRSRSRSKNTRNDRKENEQKKVMQQCIRLLGLSRRRYNRCHTDSKNAICFGPIGCWTIYVKPFSNRLLWNRSLFLTLPDHIVVLFFIWKIDFFVCYLFVQFFGCVERSHSKKDWIYKMHKFMVVTEWRELSLWKKEQNLIFVAYEFALEFFTFDFFNR